MNDAKAIARIAKALEKLPAEQRRCALEIVSNEAAAEAVRAMAAAGRALSGLSLGDRARVLAFFAERTAADAAT